MIEFPAINPVLLSLGPLQIRWYGLMYVIGFSAAFILVSRQAAHFGWKQLLAHLDNLNLTLILGVILGGRLGYVLIYNPAYYLSHPLEIPATWSGGMSFHGGLIGALLAGVLYCKRKGLDQWKVADLFIVTLPIGLFFGRLGNFINGELYGRVTSVPWAMRFPDGGPLPRHPSQLYEAGLEGILLFVILWSLKGKPWQTGTTNAATRWPHGSMLALFLILYGCCRFMVEFVREPDAQIGLIALHFSMGQILCALTAAAGVVLWVGRKKAQAQSAAA
jgi:phosphatidylglycerol:prolipoprotein diacylglycerol transferase